MEECLAHSKHLIAISSYNTVVVVVVTDIFITFYHHYPGNIGGDKGEIYVRLRYGHSWELFDSQMIF